MAIADAAGMRRALLLSIITLASCRGEPDTFIVDDPTGLAKSAALQMDGDDQLLERNGKRFSAARRIGRDADGKIQVLYADGRMFDCPIGYVTPGAAQHWNFRLTPTGCESL